MYLNTLLVVPICLFVGFCMNLDNKLVANIIYDLMAIKYNILLTRLLYSDSFASSMPSFLLNLSFTASGVPTDLQSFKPNFSSSFNAYFLQSMKMKFSV